MITRSYLFYTFSQPFIVVTRIDNEHRNEHTNMYLPTNIG